MISCGTAMLNRELSGLSMCHRRERTGKRNPFALKARGTAEWSRERIGCVSGNHVERQTAARTGATTGSDLITFATTFHVNISKFSAYGNHLLDALPNRHERFSKANEGADLSDKCRSSDGRIGPSGRARRIEEIFSRAPLTPFWRAQIDEIFPVLRRARFLNWSHWLPRRCFIRKQVAQREPWELPECVLSRNKGCRNRSDSPLQQRAACEDRLQ